jgi:adenosylhomocysteine nucleosidase
MIHRSFGFLALALLLLAPRAASAQSLVGVLGITQEVAPIEKKLENSREVVVQGYVFHVGTLKGRPVVVGRSGPGKVNAAIVATLLIGHFSPSALFFSGTAGALDPALRPGDVVIPAPRRSAEGLTLPTATTPEGDHVPRIVEGVIVTGDVFMSDSSHREELRSSLGASAIEMEGAAFIQTCRQFGVPCLVVRSVTDRADTQALTNYQKFVGMASENAATLVTAIIAQLGSRTP